jgi:hypothetical protein
MALNSANLATVIRDHGVVIRQKTVEALIWATSPSMDDGSKGNATVATAARVDGGHVLSSDKTRFDELIVLMETFVVVPADANANPVIVEVKFSRDGETKGELMSVYEILQPLRKKEVASLTDPTEDRRTNTTQNKQLLMTEAANFSEYCIGIIDVTTQLTSAATFAALRTMCERGTFNPALLDLSKVDSEGAKPVKPRQELTAGGSLGTVFLEGETFEETSRMAEKLEQALRYIFTLAVAAWVIVSPNPAQPKANTIGVEDASPAGWVAKGKMRVHATLGELMLVYWWLVEFANNAPARALDNAWKTFWDRVHELYVHGHLLGSAVRKVYADLRNVKSFLVIAAGGTNSSASVAHGSATTAVVKSGDNTEIAKLTRQLEQSQAQVANLKKRNSGGGGGGGPTTDSGRGKRKRNVQGGCNNWQKTGTCEYGNACHSFHNGDGHKCRLCGADDHGAFTCPEFKKP